jgi:hypothetical protein
MKISRRWKNGVYRGATAPGYPPSPTTGPSPSPHRGDAQNKQRNESDDIPSVVHWPFSGYGERG